MAATIGQKHKNGFKIVEIWDNHSVSLKNNLYNDFKGPEHLLGGMNLENEIDTCQTTVIGELTRSSADLTLDRGGVSLLSGLLPWARAFDPRQGRCLAPQRPVTLGRSL